MSALPDSLDWEAAFARLDRARRSLEAGEDLPAETVRRILQERAARLASPPLEAPLPSSLSVLVLSIAGERYGIETTRVREVVPLRGLTPVPCTPSFILGVMNLRGRILSVLDLGRLFDLRASRTAEGSRVVVLESEALSLGILADAVPGVVQLGPHDMAPPSGGSRPGCTRGVTADLVAILDVPALVRDPRISVNDEVA
jgi:purine-binding chemotaxis protein CheW